jgi:hypothetical protein
MPEKERAEIRNRKNGHIDHIAFDVDDIDEVFSKLKENAFQIVEDKPIFLAFWQKGCRYLNILGPMANDWNSIKSYKDPEIINPQTLKKISKCNRASYQYCEKIYLMLQHIYS